MKNSLYLCIVIRNGYYEVLFYILRKEKIRRKKVGIKFVFMIILYYIVDVTSEEQQVKHLNTTTIMANYIITKEGYELVEKLANKFAYGNTRTILFEQYKSAGLEGLIKSYETYDEGSDVKFSTYAYRTILNALINEKDRIIRHKIEEKDDYDLAKYDGEVIQIEDKEMEAIVHGLIKKAVKNNERNAKIVELHIGLNCEAMSLFDLADMFQLTHESVRLVCKRAIKILKADKTAKELLYGFVG